ncbi:MAG: hypothetical protein ACP5N7_03790 [Candidatus Pacearchaeota archaeon]
MSIYSYRPEHYIDWLLVAKDDVVVQGWDGKDILIPKNVIIEHSGKRSFCTLGVLNGPGFKKVHHIDSTNESMDKFHVLLLEQDMFDKHPSLNRLVDDKDREFNRQYNSWKAVTKMRKEEDYIELGNNFFKLLPHRLHRKDLPQYEHVFQNLTYREWENGKCKMEDSYYLTKKNNNLQFLNGGEE